MNPNTTLIVDEWQDYTLLDSGNEQKLEKFGNIHVVRPDPRAIWNHHLPDFEWTNADAQFSGNKNPNGKEQWYFKNPLPNPWLLRYKKIVFSMKPTEFKHLGIFPEQSINWDWLTEIINNRPLQILNLFAYTGGATMACTLSGAHVTHVDSIKNTIFWAKENVALSHIPDTAIRWIIDDAYAFVLREGRRGKTYDGIILDPPRFGRGPKGEVWKLSVNLPQLLSACSKILSKNPNFLLLNAYTADLSHYAIHNLVGDTMKQYNGTTVSGELCIKESNSQRLLPNGLYVRWIKNNQ
jgi:23S rRNA (cytosine1962-C5)-methyltransferase